MTCLVDHFERSSRLGPQKSGAPSDLGVGALAHADRNAGGDQADSPVELFRDLARFHPLLVGAGNAEGEEEANEEGKRDDDLVWHCKIACVATLLAVLILNLEVIEHGCGYVHNDDWYAAWQHRGDGGALEREDDLVEVLRDVRSVSSGEHHCSAALPLLPPGPVLD